MTWNTSDRRSRLPHDWPNIRRRILNRDNHQCTHCGNKATDVDHIAPGDNHADWNLTSLCAPCHKTKSSSEGGRAVHKGFRQKRVKAWRKPQKHPGLKP